MYDRVCVKVNVLCIHLSFSALYSWCDWWFAETGDGRQCIDVWREWYVGRWVWSGSLEQVHGYTVYKYLTLWPGCLPWKAIHRLDFFFLSGIVDGRRWGRGIVVHHRSRLGSAHSSCDLHVVCLWESSTSQSQSRRVINVLETTCNHRTRKIW